MSLYLLVVNTYLITVMLVVVIDLFNSNSLDPPGATQ